MKTRSIRLGITTGIVALLLPAFAACGGPAAPSGAPASQGGSAPVANTQPVTLNYWIWDKRQMPAMEQIATSFHAKYPHITVNTQIAASYGEYWTKLQAASTSGTAPDVFWMNGPNFKLYASNGQLEPLDDIKGSGDGQFDPANYPQSLNDLYSYDGKQYGVPKDFDTVTLAYNARLFKEAGVAEPTSEWKWADVQAAAQKLTDASKGIYGMFAAFYSQEGYYDTIYQAGGYVISPDGKTSGYDKPEAIAGIQYWIDFIKNGSSPDYKKMNDIDPDGSNIMMGNGTVAMQHIASYSVAALLQLDEGKAGNIKFALLPAGQKSASIIHGLGNVVYAKSPNIDAAKLFVAYLGGKEAADIQAQTGTVIPAFSGTQDTWVKSFAPEVNAQAFIDELPVTVPYPVSANTSAWANQESQILVKAWSLELTPEQACKEMADVMNAALAKE